MAICIEEQKDAMLKFIFRSQGLFAVDSYQTLTDDCWFVRF